MGITKPVLTFLFACLCAAQDIPYAPLYSTTWAGPVQIAKNLNPTSNFSGFDSVEATLVMPHLALPPNPREQVDIYTASYWIGLDGFVSADYPTVRGLWQAGVIMSIFDNGTTEYAAFYEWIPNDPVSLTSSQLAISEGQHVHVVVNTSNVGYSGTTMFTNLNTSQTFSYSQDAPTAWRGPTFPAPGSSAEWIIEAGTYLNGTQYVFPDWGNASFLDAKACYVNGECTVPGDVETGARANNTRMAVVLWNETETVYTEAHVDKDQVWIAYVEEPFVSE